jgi:polysaccharide deacetylase 2 family uncharacterized protein YibQ
MRRLTRSLAALLCAALAGSASALEPVRIAIVLDDLGNDIASGQKALSLPGAITYGFLPFTPHGSRLAERAIALDREVILHLPMEPHGQASPGAGVLGADMSREELQQQLRRNLDALPGIVGVNNHMGSRLTGAAEPMGWVMEILAERGLYFLDSRTTSDTVAEAVARARGLTTGRRHVFLDNERDEAAIRARFEELLRHAGRIGHAVAIAHPYPETLSVLQSLLSEREPHWQLVPLSEVLQAAEEERLWHASWFPSPTESRSSKRSP